MKSITFSMRIRLLHTTRRHAPTLQKMGSPAQLLPGGRFHRQFLSIAPFLPRSDVITNVVAEQPERQVRMRGPITTLAVGDYRSVRRHAGRLVHRAQLAGGLEMSGGREIPRPLDVNGARHVTAASGADQRAAELFVASRVENHRVAASDRRSDITPGGNRAGLTRSSPFGRLG